MNSNYNRGRAYEYKTMNELKAQGWEVMRTAGSHGRFDLIAIKAASREILLLQLKIGDGAEKIREKIRPIIAGYSGTYAVRADVK